jgi:hypothetical protein
MKGLVLLQELKGATRDVLLQTSASRDSVAAAQKAADADNLQLDNLRYQKGFLLREIQRCQSFRCVLSTPRCR